MPRLKPLRPLHPAQERASDPRRLVWLSASAGTGKTHVLTARVLRLLLAGTAPEAILCLTFTKAAAAEMAERVQARLAGWVRMKGPLLAAELIALGEDHSPAAVARARGLFARVLDAPGGLRIQTIHAFCQTLLASFPVEAGLAPGFSPIEGREEAQLARRTLAELLVRAEAGGDLPLIADVQALSRRLGEGEAERFLLACARAPDAMAALGPAQGIEARLRRDMDVPSGDIEAHLADACHDDAFDRAALGEVAAHNAGWGTRSGLRRADAIARWLALTPAERVAGLADLHLVWAKADGEPRSTGRGQAPPDPAYADHAARLHSACAALLALRAKAAYAGFVAAALRAGQAYARAYAGAKRAAGLVDFDDLIRATVRLLNTDGMGEWVRYKLDQSTDHILVDEAQDTNGQQWAIVAALAGEYFAGAGARPTADRDGAPARTIFTVGDYKQAIFGFQGTDPAAFRAAQLAFQRHAEEVGRGFDALALDRSFRTTPPVLALVDRLIGDLGDEAMGLFEGTPPHLSARAGLLGSVTLWRASAADAAGEEAEEGWLDDATLGFATKLARQVRAWLDEPLMLEASGRPLRPEDVLILVRKRGDLASLIVARLHAEGVPVAGVDRLRLNAPLAVRDLLACARFALQPRDDLTLAALLVSPLFGLSQDALFDVAWDRPGSLLEALERSGHAAVGGLRAILDMADLTTPYRFFETILSGPMDGRRRLLARLGAEAADPIDELLAAALDFEDRATPSLQLFLDWFDRGDVDIKRDPSAPLDAVRVMTVHGAKGLEAPLVVLADATGDPELSPARGLAWAGAPVPRPRREERHEPFAGLLADEEARERAEHWRLLYVAATRAGERLVVAGALTPRMRGVPPAASWYTAVDRALDGMGAAWADDPRWGAARHHAAAGDAAPASPKRRTPPEPAEPPAWARRPAPREQRPPRPLAPSAVGRDLVADPPPLPAKRAAAERGRLLHALFERLPALPAAARAAAGERWLAESAGVADQGLRRALVADACAIMADPRFAEVFAADALAEAPVAAVVAGAVVAGTIDRLLVAPDRVMLVDFKTGRRAPAGVDAVPPHHVAQMAAYAAALAVVFPDRPVEAALLYTAGPSLIPLPAALLAAHKPGFAPAEESFVAAR